MTKRAVFCKLGSRFIIRFYGLYLESFRTIICNRDNLVKSIGKSVNFKREFNNNRKCFELSIMCVLLTERLFLQISEKRRPIIFMNLREAVIPIRGSSCEETIKENPTSGVPG